MKDVRLTRYKANPILPPIPDHPWEAHNVSNAGAIEHAGKVHILYRAEGFEERQPPGFSKWPVTSLGLAISSDGFTIDERLPDPVIRHRPGGAFGEHGIQDPRIARVEDTYYITTAGVSRWGDRVILYKSVDLRTYEEIGVLQPEHEMRTAGMFPEKFGADYCFLLRYQPNMWISYTRDFQEWHDTKLVWECKKNSWYGRKLGLGATPIRQDDAWLLFWHGKADGPGIRYALGVMWLDLEDPAKILKVQQEPILSVEMDYEREGYCPNVVYTCGAVELDGKYIVYYGCADRVLAAASVPVEECRL